MPAGWPIMRAGTYAARRQLEMSLQGTMTTHQRLLLARMLEQMNALEIQLAALTEEIEQRVSGQEAVLKRLDTIPGIDRIAAWTVLAEIGTDMSVFADARHLASWAALCPGNRESGGKRISGKTRKGNRYVRRALCQSAWAATRTKDTHLTALYRRIRSRRGEQKAIMAVAHQLLTIVFNVIRDGSVYRELGAGYYDRQNKPKLTRRLIERLEKLGYYVTLQPIEAPVSEAPIDTAETPPPVRRKRGRPCKCAERGLPCKHGSLNPDEINAKEIRQPGGGVEA